MWKEVTELALKSTPGANTSILTKLLGKKDTSSSSKAQRSDSDIINLEEEQCPISEKVMLIVNRCLGDENTVPGHVYRVLVKEFKRRHGGSDTSESDNPDEPAALSPSILIMAPPTSDAHGVISHVTEVLLNNKELLKGGGKRVIAMTETAVDGIVFGELYHYVYAEICKVTKKKDEELNNKIDKYLVTRLLESKTDAAREEIDKSEQEGLSPAALLALRTLSSAHTAVDKLACCVRALEDISSMGVGGKGVDADSLLKLLCRHIVFSKCLNLNADVMFMEEFARDKHLMIGKDGYALVTVQAAVHFLGAMDCTDYKDEIW